MSFVHSKDELLERKKHFAKGYVLGDATMVIAVFRTKEDVIRKVLPPPLEPGPIPTGTAYVAEFHRTNFGVTYNEAALFLSAQYKGFTGNYCLAMPVTNDIAMIGGREVYGFPKKIADEIHVKRKGDIATGVCIRRGIQIIELKVDIVEHYGDSMEPTPNFVFKAFPSLENPGIEGKVRLVKQINDIDWGPVETGEGEIKLVESKYDPLYEIPIEEVLAAFYTEGTEIRMNFGEVLTEVSAEEYEPYFFIKSDWDF